MVGALTLAERIRCAAESAPADWDGTPIPFTISMGISIYQPEHRKPEDLIHETDLALYFPRKTGAISNRFDPAVHKRHWLRWQNPPAPAAIPQIFAIQAYRSAAMPFFAPGKAEPLGVLAFTLTSSGNSARSAAMWATICAICGAIFGTWA